MIVEDYANLQGEIFISCQQLFDFLTSSEAKAAKKREGTGRAKTLPATVKKQRRTETPPDQLNTDDEKYFECLELRASKKVDREDATYNASAGTRSSEGRP